MINAPISSRLVNDRFAAGREHLQVEAILAVEGIADRAERMVRRRVKEIAATVPDGDLVDRFSGVIRTLIVDLAREFALLVPWTYDRTVRLYASTIPRAWWRAEFPTLVFAEDQNPGIPPIVPRNDLEPVTAKQNMSPAEWQAKLKEFVFPPPTEQQTRDILLRPINGRAWPERVQQLSRLVTDAGGLGDQITRAYAAGATLDDLEKIARPFADNVTASARRIVRTEGLRIANEVGRTQYAKLGKMLQGVQIVATLDENTRPEHAARNGTIYWAVPGKTPTLAEMPSLPDECNCRCHDQPVLTPPPGAKDPRFQATFANASGKTIPDPSAYSQWFSNADTGRQKMAVGVNRFNTVAKSGQTPTWFDFIDKDGQLVPLDRLRRETTGQRRDRTAEVERIARDREVMFKQVAATGFVPGVGQPLPPRPPLPKATTPIQPLPQPPAPRTVPTPSPIKSGGKYPTFSGATESDLRKKVIAAIDAGQTDSIRGVRSIGTAIREEIEKREDIAGLRAAYQAQEDAWKKLSELTHQKTITPDIWKQIADLRFNQNERQRTRDAYLDGLSKAYRESLSSIRDFGGDVQWNQHDRDKSNPDAEKHLSLLGDALGTLPSDWIADVRKAYKDGITFGRANVIRRDGDDRSSYLLFRGSIGLGSKADAGVAAHELMHLAEEVRKSLNTFALAWRNNRIKPDEKTIRLKNDPGSRCFEDEFTTPYIGRVYGADGRKDTSRSSEVLSMGIEGVLYGKYGILLSDAEMTDFILGMLAAR